MSLTIFRTIEILINLSLKLQSKLIKEKEKLKLSLLSR